MKGLKKLLALLLAVTMIASVLAVPVFAADEDEPLSNGAKLELLGLLIGDGDGVTDTYLAKSSTRMQLAILNARWLAYEDEAYDFEDWDDEVNFVDYDDRTSEAEWNMLAYYYNDPDLGFIGIGYDVFAPQDPITNKQLAKILLVAMGYPYGDEYDWNDILGFAADIGIDLGSSEVEITNADLADALVAALEAVTAFGDEEEPMTFAQYLMDLGVVTEDDLIAAGIAYIYVPEGEEAPGVELPTLEVVSASASNFVEVELTFNQKVDPDSVDFVSVKVDNVNVSDGAKVYVVDDYGDGKVVRIFEPVKFVGAQNEYRTISVVGLKTPGGIAMTAFSQQITFRDSTAPTIEKIVAKGNTRLDVFFSEPIQEVPAVKTLSNYQVGGKALSASQPTLDGDTGRKVTIKSIRTSLSAGVYVLGILGENFKDYAENTLGYQTSEFEILSKTEGPIAQKVLDPVYQYKVQIEFDDEIQDDAVIRWADGSKTYSSDSTSVDGNVATFEFTDKKKVIPIAGTTITLVGAKDYWNNAAQQPLSFDVVPVADTLRPQVISYGADKEGSIWIKFNKKIGDFAFSKWTIKNPDDDKVNGTTNWEVKTDDKKITLNGKTGDAQKSGVYKITLKDVADTVLPDANKILDVTIEVDVPDTTAPSIVSATWGKGGEKYIINIFFDEEVDYSSAVTRGNYKTRIDGASYTSLPNTAKVGLQSGNRTVTLTFNENLISGSEKVEVSVVDVQDLYGNRMNDSKEVTPAAFINMGKVTATAKAVNKIEVDFGTGLLTATDDSWYSLVSAQTLTAPKLSGIDVDYTELNDGGATLVIYTTSDISANGYYKGNPFYVKFSNDVLDIPAGELPVIVDDGIDPSISEDSYVGDDNGDYPWFGDNIISLVFDEAVFPQGYDPVNETGDIEALWLSGAFKTIKYDGKVIDNMKITGEENEYGIQWYVDAAVKSGDDYIVNVHIGVVKAANADDQTSVDDEKDIEFTYNKSPGATIFDFSENELDDVDFRAMKFNVSYTYREKNGAIDY